MAGLRLRQNQYILQHAACTTIDGIIIIHPIHTITILITGILLFIAAIITRGGDGAGMVARLTGILRTI